MLRAFYGVSARTVVPPASKRARAVGAKKWHVTVDAGCPTMGGTMTSPSVASTSRARVARDDEIIRMRAEGETWKRIAERHGISTRQCRRVVTQSKTGMRSLPSMDAIEWVESTYLLYEEAIDQLQEIAEISNNASARVGAIKAAVAVQAEETALLQAVGVLPRNLGRLAVELDVRHVATTVTQVFEEFAVPREATDAILRILNRATPAPDGILMQSP